MEPGNEASVGPKASAMESQASRTPTSVAAVTIQPAASALLPNLRGAHDSASTSRSTAAKSTGNSKQRVNGIHHCQPLRAAVNPYVPVMKTQYPKPNVSSM